MTAPPVPSPVRRAFWLVTAAVLGAWALHNAFLLPRERALLPPAVFEPALLALRALVWLVPIALYLDRHGREPALAALGLTGRVDRRGLAVVLAPAALYLALAGVLAAASSDAPRPSDAVAFLASLPTLYLLVGVVLEEVLMRGFILRRLLGWMRPWRAVLLGAALFAAMHVPGWLAMGVGLAILPSTAFVLLQGLVLGYVAYRSRSIWPAIAVHAVNNLLADWFGGR